MSYKTIHSGLASVSRKLTFLPRGKVGVSINKLLIGNMSDEDNIVQFEANNGLKYIADLRSYTENYTPWTGEYEGKTMASILPLVPKNMNVLDIGANVGYWTINLASRITDKNKVFSFEPVGSNYNRILEHIRLNGLSNKCFVYNIGLSDKETTANIHINPSDLQNGASTFNATIQEGEGDCLVQKLDDLYIKEKIKNVGFIKIDVEGFEVKAFRGAAKFLSENRPVIYGEFTPDLIYKAGDKPQEIFALLQDYTFLQENKDNSFSYLKDEHYTRDLLLVPNEKLEEIKAQIRIR